MSDAAVITIASVAAGVAVILVIQFPDILASWSKTKTEAANTAMKQQMIERGFSAEEILQVLRAGTAEEPKPAASGAAEKPASPGVPAHRE